MTRCLLDGGIKPRTLVRFVTLFITCGSFNRNTVMLDSQSANSKPSTRMEFVTRLRLANPTLRPGHPVFGGHDLSVCAQMGHSAHFPSASEAKGDPQQHGSPRTSDAVKAVYLLGLGAVPWPNINRLKIHIHTSGDICN